MQQFDSDMRQMKDKIKELYAPSERARMNQQNTQRMQAAGIGGSGLSGDATQAFKNAAKADIKELDNFISKQAKSQASLNTAIDNRTKKLKELKREYQEIVKLGKDDLKVKEDIARNEAKRSRLQDQVQQKITNTNAALNAREGVQNNMGGGGGPRETLSGRERLYKAYAYGGAGGLIKAGYRMGGGALGVAGLAMTTLGAGMEFGGKIMGREASADRRMESSQGGAVQGMGIMANNIMSGQGSRNSFYAPEHRRALQGAMKEMGRQRTADSVGVAGGMLKTAGAAAAAGSTAGAVIGGGIGVAGGPAAALTIPALSMAGAKAGFLVGGGLGLAKGAYNVMSNERSFNKVMGGMGIGDYEKRYESSLAKEMVSNYQTNLENEKNLSPGRKRQRAYYERNVGKNLGMQRTLGQGDEEFYGEGGYLRSTLGAGFSQEQGMQATSQILGAGGSTRMARTPEEALRFTRQTNLTNAGSVMGKLSGTLGGAGESENATVKILAEGMKKGLDSSEFAGEQRKFASTVAQMVYRSGTQTGEGAGAIAANFGSFLQNKTGRGIEAANTAYGKSQQISKITGGIRGAIQAANISSDPILSKMGHDSRMAFMKLSTEDILAGGAVIEAMADEAGIDVEEFKQIAVKAKSKHSSSRESTDALAKSYMEAKTSGDIGPKETRRRLGAVIKARMGENSDLDGMSQQARESLIDAQAQAQFGSDSGIQNQEAQVRKQMAGKVSGIGVSEEGSRAKSEGLALDEFSTVSEELKGAADAFVQSNVKILQAHQEFADSLIGEKGVTKAAEEMAKKLIEITQEIEGNKPSSGFQQPTGSKGKGQ